MIDQGETGIMEVIMRDQERRFVMNNIAKPATGETQGGKPRICEVLGGEDHPLQVGERFDVCARPYGGAFRCLIYKGAYVDGDGVVRTNIGTPMDGEWVSRIVNDPDRIIRKPRFTEEEVADAAALMRILDATRIEKSEYGENLCAVIGEIARVVINDDLFPSLLPGQSVALADICGC